MSPNLHKVLSGEKIFNRIIDTIIISQMTLQKTNKTINPTYQCCSTIGRDGY